VFIFNSLDPSAPVVGSRAYCQVGAGDEPRLVMTAHHEPLLGSVSLRNVDPATVPAADDVHPPRATTDLAILHEAASDVRLDVDLDGLAAVRTRDREVVRHQVSAGAV